MEVRKAESKDLIALSMMLMSMYKELMPGKCSLAESAYRKEMRRYLLRDYVGIIDDVGFYVIKDVSTAILLDKRYEGIAVYIKPEARKSRALSIMYNHMFKTFTDGDIYGFVEPNSEHLNVLTKRHDLLGHIFKLKRTHNGS